MVFPMLLSLCIYVYVLCIVIVLQGDYVHVGIAYSLQVGVILSSYSPLNRGDRRGGLDKHPEPKQAAYHRTAYSVSTRMLPLLALSADVDSASSG